MIYEITGSGISARVDSLGAQLISLMDEQGTEYIWQRNPQVWSSCSPLLFPIIGNLRDGKTIIEGKVWEMPKHGFTRNTWFHLLNRTESSVTLGMSDSDFPEHSFPFAFEFSITYSLDGKTLTFFTEIRNPADRELPFCYGLHPAIRCPLFAGESFEDYVIRFGKPQLRGYRAYDLETLQFDKSSEHPFPGSGTDIPLSHSLFSSDALWFDRPDSHEVSIINLKSGRGIRARFEDFATVAFWTKPVPEAEYICIEPWNGSSVCSDEDDDFLHKNHLRILRKGEQASYRLSLEIRQTTDV